MILFCLLSGCYPFWGKTDKELFEGVLARAPSLYWTGFCNDMLYAWCCDNRLPSRSLPSRLHC